VNLQTTGLWDAIEYGIGEYRRRCKRDSRRRSSP
jgi:hypothetical protein